MDPGHWNQDPAGPGHPGTRARGPRPRALGPGDPGLAPRPGDPDPGTQTRNLEFPTCLKRDPNKEANWDIALLNRDSIGNPWGPNMEPVYNLRQFV